MPPKFSCEIAPENYSLFGKGDYPLPARDVYYWHLSNTSEDLIPSATIDAFKRAINIWQMALDGLPPKGNFLRFESTSDVNKSDYVISFGKSEHMFPYGTSDGKQYKKCPYDFDGASGVLAHAFTLEAHYPYGGQLHMDENENWGSMHTKNKTDLLTVFLHEFGHCLGIAHSDDANALMYPSYNGEKRTLHKDDVLALSAKLGKVKKIIYERYHEKYEKRGIDKFDLLPKFWQKLLRGLYGKRLK